APTLYLQNAYGRPTLSIHVKHGREATEGIASRTRNLLCDREAMAGVGAASPDQSICDAVACAVLQMHILSCRFVKKPQRRWPQNISCPDHWK
ncbi:hypothetical protein, partial [Pectobacterium carotovorum]|uniref:hypothetical protein n=1 Tax=Pectobacterium carotovorum TaxID=554 RepID=UPI001B80E206